MDMRAVTRGNAVRLPFRDASFDLVYSFGVLLLVGDLDAAVAGVSRAQARGTVITMFYNRQSLQYYLKTLTMASSATLGDLPGRAISSTVHRRLRIRGPITRADSLRKAFDRFTTDRLWCAI